MHTSSKVMDASPPPTSLLTQVIRASSLSRRAFATHLRASFDASGSLLKAVTNSMRAERFAEVAMTSEPAGFLPSVLIAKSACAASEWKGAQLRDMFDRQSNQPFIVSLPAGSLG